MERSGFRVLGFGRGGSALSLCTNWDRFVMFDCSAFSWRDNPGCDDLGLLVRV